MYKIEIKKTNIFFKKTMLNIAIIIIEVIQFHFGVLLSFYST